MTRKEAIKRLSETSFFRSFKVIYYNEITNHCEILVQDKTYGNFKCCLKVCLTDGFMYSFYQGEESPEMLIRYKEALRK